MYSKQNNLARHGMMSQNWSHNALKIYAALERQLAKHKELCKKTYGVGSEPSSSHRTAFLPLAHALGE